MKIKFMLVLGILMMILFSSLYASSTTVLVGNSSSTTSANYYPIDYYYQSSLSQTIYYPDELNMVGSITGISYRFNLGTQTINKPIKIWMANTATTDFGTATLAASTWIPYDQFTLVYEGTPTLSGTGLIDFNITLTTPFIYSGNKLVVMVQRPMDTAYFSSSSTFINTATANHPNRLIYYYNDDIENLPTAYITPSGRVSNVPNTKFTFDTTSSNTLTGIIRKNGTQLPVANAKVTINETMFSVMTDANGAYNFLGLNPGIYSLKIEKAGYATSNITNLEIIAGVNTHDDVITLLPVNAAVYTLPANKQLNQYNYVDFKWNTPTDGEVAGYRFNLWKLVNPDVADSLAPLVNNVEIGNVNQYRAGNLEYNSVYYWQVVPYDAGSSAPNCPVWKFTTLPDPTITAIPYAQLFDTGITTPALPLGWTSLFTNSTATSSVATTTTGIPYSSSNHVILVSGTNPIGKVFLIAPPVNVANSRVRFFAKSSSTNPKLTVGYIDSPWDSTTFVPLKTFSLTSTYTEYFVKITDINNKKLAFRNDGGTTSVTIYVDNIKLETIPTVELAYSLSTLDFGRNYIQRLKNRTLLITNNGSESANLTLEMPAIVTTAPTGAITVLPDQTLEILVKQLPTVEVAAWADSIIVNSNDPVVPRKKIVLQGSILPYLGDGVVEFSDGAATNQSLPVEPYFGYSLSQSIYYPSDLYPSDNHAITEISYEYNKNSAWTDSIKIWFDMVPKNTFTGSTDWVQVMSNNLVYKGTLTTSTTASWITLPLTTPFIYDPAWDLVVTVLEYTSGFHSSSAEFYCTPTTDNRSLEYHNDTILPNPYAITQSGTLRKYMPNTRFKFVATAPNLALSSDSLVYNRQFVGSYSAPKTIQLQSNGSGNVWIDNVRIVYADTLVDQFSIINTDETPFVLAPYSSKDINITFNPTEVGMHQAYLEVVYRYHMADQPDTVMVLLKGTSVDATINDYPYVQNFSGELFPPYGWTIFKEEFSAINSIPARDMLRRIKNESSNRDNQNTENWLRSESSNAGEAPELQFHWSPSFEGRSMFISPVVNATNKNYIKVSFDFNCIPYQNNDDRNAINGEIGFMVKSGANNWQKWWYSGVNHLMNNHHFERIIDISQLPNPKFQIALYYEGNTWYINDWYVDNLNIEETAGIFNAPENLVATPGYREVNLYWMHADPYLPNTLTSYNIYRNGELYQTIGRDTLNNLSNMFVDNQVENNTEYSYFVTAVYTAPNGESLPTSEVTATPFVPPFPNQVNLSSQIEDEVNVNLSWNMVYGTQYNFEFRYDDGMPNNYVYTQPQTYLPNLRMGNVFRNNAEITHVKWYSSNNFNGTHDYASVHIFGLDNNLQPNIGQVLYQTSYIPNINNAWNTFVLPYTVYAPNGFIVCVDYPDSRFEMPLDDGFGSPWNYTPNAVYFTPDAYSQQFNPFNATGNLMVRAIGTNYGMLNMPRAVNITQKTKLPKDLKITNNTRSNNNAPQRIPFNNQRFEVYRNNSLIATLPFDTYNYRDTLLANGTYQYYVKAFYTDNYSTPESNREMALIGPFVFTDEDTLDYQIFEPNRQTPFWEVTISNPGSVMNIIDSVYVTDTLNFVLDQQYQAFPLMPFGGNHTIRVAFRPSHVNNFFANLVIRDSSNTEYTVALKGLGVDPTIRTFPYVQDFSGPYFPPVGWRTRDFNSQGDTLLTHHFRLNQSNNANGEVPELMFDSYFNDSYINGKSLFISPVIDANGIDNMLVSFNDAVYGANGLCEIGLAVKGEQDNTWTAVWAERPVNNYYSRQNVVEIDVRRISSPLYRFAFYFKGNVNRLYQWNIDDVALGIKPPMPPTELVAFPGNNTVNLHWYSPQQSVRAFLGYNVYKNGQLVNQTPVQETQFTDNNVVNNNNYTYYVTALYSNPALESVPSNTVRVTPMAPVLNPPQNLQLAVMNEDDVIVNWNRPSSSFMDDFEFIMPGWKTYDLDNNEQSWTITDGRPHSGMYSLASFAIPSYYYSYNNNWLVSPRVHISGETVLKYWIASVDTVMAENGYFITVSTQSDSTQHFVHYMGYNSTTSSNYEERTLDLSEFNGQDIYIAWVHEGYNYNSNAQGILLDDVSIVNQAIRTPLLTTSFENISKDSKITALNAVSVNPVNNQKLTSANNKAKKNKSASERVSQNNMPFTKLIGYKIFRNNTLIETVGDSVFNYVDYNRPDGTQSYNICAVYNKGTSVQTPGKKAFVGRSIKPDPAYKDFGTIPVLGQSQAQVFALVNDGTKKIKPHHITLADTTNFGMVIHNPLPDSMMIGDTIFVSTYFKPQAAGEFNTVFTIVDTTNNYNRPITLKGTGNPLVVNNFPFVENFTLETFPPLGWSVQQYTMALAPQRSSSANRPVNNKAEMNHDRTNGNWSRSATVLAGGETGELKFYYSPQFTGVSRFISPIINAENKKVLFLQFKHFVDWYENGFELGVAVRKMGQTEWMPIWSVMPEANIPSETVNLDIPVEELNLGKFQYCFYFLGNSFDIDYWYIDNIKVFEPMQKIPLSEGWNILSSGIIPSTANMMDLFQPLMNNSTLVKIQNEAGASLEYVNGAIGWVNNIGNFQNTEGYKVKVSANDTLRISGQPVVMPFEIPLLSGWNIASYPCKYPMETYWTFMNLIEHNKLQKVQNESGQALEFIEGLGWIDNIGILFPGEGYKVKVSADTSLFFGEYYVMNTAQASKKAVKSIIVKDETRTSNHFTPVWSGNGVDHMNIYITSALVNGLPVNTDNEIAVFDGNICVGAVKLNSVINNYVSLVVSRNESNNANVNGYTDGHAISFRIWNGEQEYTVSNPEYSNGVNVFNAGSTAVVALNANTLAGDNNTVTLVTKMNNAYPNPFNPSTRIDYSVKSKSKVLIEIFNVKGQKVKTLVNENKNPGKYSIVWNGEDQSGKRAASGIYFYKMEAGSYHAVKKAVLLK